jgi:hypothetical protein
MFRQKPGQQRADLLVIIDDQQMTGRAHDCSYLATPDVARAG